MISIPNNNGTINNNCSDNNSGGSSSSTKSTTDTDITSSSSSSSLSSSKAVLIPPAAGSTTTTKRRSGAVRSSEGQSGGPNKPKRTFSSDLLLTTIAESWQQKLLKSTEVTTNVDESNGYLIGTSSTVGMTRSSSDRLRQIVRKVSDTAALKAFLTRQQQQHQQSNNNNTTTNNNDSSSSKHQLYQKVLLPRLLLVVAIAFCCLNLYTMINVVNTNTSESSSSSSSTSSGGGGSAATTSKNNGYDNTPELIDPSSIRNRQLLLGNETDTEDEDYEVEYDTNEELASAQPTRVLLGIFTTLQDIEQRNIYRKLLQTHYPRVCSLYDFENTIVPILQSDTAIVLSKYNFVTSSVSSVLRKLQRRKGHSIGSDHHNNNHTDCTLIYTFVLGMEESVSDTTTAGDDPIEELPTEITTNRARMDLERQPPPQATTGSSSSSSSSSSSANDWNEKDMTYLAIRENVHEGKSQTWLYYASKITKKYDGRTVTIKNSTRTTTTYQQPSIDYIMKTSRSTWIDYDRLLDFISTEEGNLPSYPYNQRIMASAFANKYWWKMSNHHKKQTELFYHIHYQTCHIYPTGPMYILSTDLVYDILQLTTVISNQPILYKQLEGFEDHDIGFLAQVSAIRTSPDYPVTFVMLPFGNHSIWESTVPDLAEHVGSDQWKEKLPTITSYELRKRGLVRHKQKRAAEKKKKQHEEKRQYVSSKLREQKKKKKQAKEAVDTTSGSEQSTNTGGLRTTTTTTTASKGSKKQSKTTDSISEPQKSTKSTANSETKSAEETTLTKDDTGVSTTSVDSTTDTNTDVSEGTTAPTEVQVETESTTTEWVLHDAIVQLREQYPSVLLNATDNVSLLWHLNATVPTLFTLADIDNTIADSTNDKCFIDTSGTHRPFKMIEFNADGGKDYDILYSILKNFDYSSSKSTRKELLNPDIIILNEMDYTVTIPLSSIVVDEVTGLLRSNRTYHSTEHTTRSLAMLLNMNYVWAIDSINVLSKKSSSSSEEGENEEEEVDDSPSITLQLRGNAILSNCQFFDTKILRDPIIDSVINVDKKPTDFELAASKAGSVITSSRGLLDRLQAQHRRGGMALFARAGRFEDPATASSIDGSNSGTGSVQNILVASVHHFQAKTQERVLWEIIHQQGPYKIDPKLFLDENMTHVVRPVNQIGTIISGDTDKSICPTVGMHNIDRHPKFWTYPVRCTTEDFGPINTVTICSDLQIFKKFTQYSHLPCYTPRNEQVITQISKHGIIARMFK